ncbi:MAG: response regulator [Deltaproteobacteria bacterium]|nr:response regulator [Deltaproteobacteria bacterium]
MKIIGYLQYFFALIVGILPWAFAGFSISHIKPGDCGLSALGFLLAYTQLKHLRNDKLVRETASALGLDNRGTLEQIIAKLCDSVQKFHSLYFGYEAKDHTDHLAVMVELRRIVEMAYVEFCANSAELALVDEYSGVRTQAILVGVPRSEYAQSSLLEAANNAETSAELMKRAGVFVEKVAFAGYLFGTFRVELGKGNVPTQEQRNMLNLFSMHCAITLINSRFTDELIRMRRHSEESVKAKTGFLANLSHEIRGPLGVIISGVELILEGICGEVSEQQNQTLGMIKKNGEHLLDLVNDVLDYAKTEAGKIKAEPVSLCVADLVSDLANVVRSQANSKEQKLITKPVEKYIGVKCDKRHARQILINLLTNAIKYTPNGGTITIDVALEKANKVKISVTDTGIGIPKDQQDRVFNAFERVEDSYAQQQMGTGLGMPIACKLCEINKGVMDFTSEQGKGSCFWIELPYVEIEDEYLNPALTGKQQVIKSYGQGEQILLVQPDNEEKDILVRYLTFQGFEVESVSSSRGVQQALKQGDFKLLVIDNDFDNLNAEELLFSIRNNPRGKNLPMVMISARAFSFDVEYFLKLGVERCLSKPIDLADLARIVHSTLHPLRN